MTEVENFDQLLLSTKHINLIKWTPKSSTHVKKIRIAENIASKWKEMANLIGLRHPQISSIENCGSGKTPVQCLDDVLQVWEEDKDGENQIDYPYNWSGLLELLEDMEYCILAANVKKALASEQNSVRKSEMNESNINIAKRKDYTSVFLCLTVGILFIAYCLWNIEDIKSRYIASVTPYSKSLPNVCQYFVGRENDTEELLNKLNSDNIRIVNVLGLSGIGKSQLAKNVGHKMRDRFGFHVYYIDLSDFSGKNIGLVLAENILPRNITKRVLKLVEVGIELASGK